MSTARRLGILSAISRRASARPPVAMRLEEVPIDVDGHRDEEIALPREVVEDRAARKADRLFEAVHCRAVVAVLGERLRAPSRI